jgi:hypothetical protein
MEYLVMVTAALLLIGSISIAMPSKSSRKISKLRINAKMLGCKISSNLYGKNKFKNKKSFDVSYQIKNLTTLKEGHFIRDKNKFILYSPVKLKYLDHFNDIERVLLDMPESANEIIFSNISISFLWKESDGIKELETILKKLNDLKNL